MGNLTNCVRKRALSQAAAIDACIESHTDISKYMKAAVNETIYKWSNQ
jgi:hypothetical protein